jgi:hypothetical protein
MKIVRPLALFAIAALLAACSTSTPSSPSPRAPQASRPFPDEGITTTTAGKAPAVAQLRVGQTASLAVVDVAAGQTGAVAPQLAVDPSKPTVGTQQVARIKFTSGSEYDRPQRGLYLGAYMRIQVIHNTDLTWNLYAVVNGHHYDQGFAAEGFSPSLDYVDLNDGEAAEGWLVFDVPARHGELVLVDGFSNSKIAVWSF